jgi:hypothetical protein
MDAGGLPQSAWLLGQDIIHKTWLPGCWRSTMTNAFLIERGVMVEIDLAAPGWPGERLLP